MLSFTIATRSTISPLRMIAVRRLNSTSSVNAAPRPAPKSKGQGLNQPKYIFWGWTALIFVAGYGYFTVKANNTAKKREFMIRQGQELQQRNAALAEDGQPPANAPPVLMSSGSQEKYAQSPLQSLAAAFNRQTTQRSRNPTNANSE
ncbi:uncharacterized protein UTRI_02121_B [Ustilago trichophora]|uniref:Uncharacterized protein n=1 Tax=Ustilago trichophora TaxID=86804 RepID=A0A5C3DY19_9BASI|nr:uncharacterized protein UTRI_02121_B [Ustilago trichophora]